MIRGRSEADGKMDNEVPTTPRSVRLSELDLERLGRLQRRLGRSQTEVISMGIAHLLATILLDERVHLVVPGEEPEGDKNPRKSQ